MGGVWIGGSVGAEEAAALSFLGLAGPAEELGLAGVLDVARTKVWAALTGEARSGRSAARSASTSTRSAGTAPREPTPCLRRACRRRVARPAGSGSGTSGGHGRGADGRPARARPRRGRLVPRGPAVVRRVEHGERRTYRVSRIRSVSCSTSRRTARPSSPSERPGSRPAATWSAATTSSSHRPGRRGRSACPAGPLAAVPLCRGWANRGRRAGSASTSPAPAGASS